jgi:hypothetical protein
LTQQDFKKKGYNLSFKITGSTHVYNSVVNSMKNAGFTMIARYVMCSLIIVPIGICSGQAFPDQKLLKTLVNIRKSTITLPRCKLGERTICGGTSLGSKESMERNMISVLKLIYFQRTLRDSRRIERMKRIRIFFIFSNQQLFLAGEE